MIPPYGEWIDPRAFKLPPTAFSDYLLAHGWKFKSSSSNSVEFAAPDSENGVPYITMPTTRKASDFPLRVDDFFRRLSILEERHPMAILQEILRQSVAGSDEHNGKNGSSRAKRPTRVRKTQLKK